MYSKGITTMLALMAIGLSLSVLIQSVHAQSLLDRILERREKAARQDEAAAQIASAFGQNNNSNSNQLPLQNSIQDATGRARNMFRDMMSVNVPVFYDMVRNGSSLGINVLSGLVKVERGQEAERSGLAGPRPLSVRIFGVPVFERGTRVRPLSDAPSTRSPFIGTNGNEPKLDDNTPLDP